ncbi:NAD(P)/FAD-dependent oxidoreductase [Slackia heliotrinireducens]|uniref:NAD(P)/FAD-dependent oxidoreductase n=1 Tax=Slackia heliotrinireducens TaxID=84110 RepID=UPI003315EC25
MKNHYESIVLGAGAAGMNCCLELQKEKREYLLVSPNIGGRICNDEERHMNYGAVFYFGTYKHMLASGLLKGTVDVLPKLSMGQCHHDDGKSYEPVSATTVADMPSLLAYMKWMRETFIPRYSAFKDNCCTMEVSAALDKDPMIKELYTESAEHFIERMGFGPICHDLVSMFAHACTGTKIRDLTALDYLNTVQPLTMKIFNVPPLKLLFDLKRFDFDSEGVKQRLGSGSGEVHIGEAVSITRMGGGWRVTTDDGSMVMCSNLVMATPAHVTAQLLAGVPGVPELDIRKASQLTGYLIRGKAKPGYAEHTVHLFDDTIPIIYIAKRLDGDYEIFTEVDFEEGRKFDEYFDEWEVIGKKYWEYALYTAAHEALPQNLAPGLIMAGDVNGLGMEPATISGIYAANKIMGKTVD